MAMFGMTAGSLIVYFRACFSAQRLLEHLSWISMAFAIAVVISTVSMVSSVLLTGLTSGMMALLWFKLILTILPPYVLAGMAISLALTRVPGRSVSSTASTVGAATGCLLVLGVLTWMDGVSALLAVGAIGAVAAACFRAAWRGAAIPLCVNLAVSRWFGVAASRSAGILIAAVALFKLDPTARDRARAGEGSGRKETAGRTAMEFVLSCQG